MSAKMINNEDYVRRYRELAQKMSAIKQSQGRMIEAREKKYLNDLSQLKDKFSNDKYRLLKEKQDDTNNIRNLFRIEKDNCWEEMRALTAEYRKATGQPTDCEVRHFIDNLIDETGGAAVKEKEGGEA